MELFRTSLLAYLPCLQPHYHLFDCDAIDFTEACSFILVYTNVFRLKYFFYDILCQISDAICFHFDSKIRNTTVSVRIQLSKMPFAC